MARLGKNTLTLTPHRQGPFRYRAAAGRKNRGRPPQAFPPGGLRRAEGGPRPGGIRLPRTRRRAGPPQEGSREMRRPQVPDRGHERCLYPRRRRRSRHPLRKRRATHHGSRQGPSTRAVAGAARHSGNRPRSGKEAKGRPRDRGASMHPGKTPRAHCAETLAGRQYRRHRPQGVPDGRAVLPADADGAPVHRSRIRGGLEYRQGNDACWKPRLSRRCRREGRQGSSPDDVGSCP